MEGPTRDRTRPPPEEIPQLKAMGLTCVDTAGSGNCLFHALSDQLYGNQMHHVQLRADTVDYMRRHPDEFKRFVTVHPGGGIRRNPKRKTTSSVRQQIHHYRPPHQAHTDLPSEADIERAFALSLDLMAQGGTYGDNAEIIAFARRFRVGIRIWHVANAAFYTIEGSLTPEHAAELPISEEGSQSSEGGSSVSSSWSSSPRILYIVYHTYEHYSSVRNVNGPFEGPPQISPQMISREAQLMLQKELANEPTIHDWMIDMAMESLPYITDRNMVIQTLKQCKGNINLAVDFLLPESSTATSDRSSSIEPDIENDENYPPRSKRRSRTAGRPHPLSNDALPLRQRNGIESHRVPINARHGRHGHKSPDPRRLAIALRRMDRQTKEYDPDETEEEDWRDDAGSIDTSASEYSERSQALSFAPQPRFRLSQPRPPDNPGTIDGTQASSYSSSFLGSERPVNLSIPPSPGTNSSPEPRVASPYKAARILLSPRTSTSRHLAPSRLLQPMASRPAGRASESPHNHDIHTDQQQAGPPFTVDAIPI